MVIEVCWIHAVPVLGYGQFGELLIPNKQAICLLLADVAVLAHIFYPTMTAEYLRTAQNSVIDDLLSFISVEHRLFYGCLDLELVILGLLGDPFSDLLSSACRLPP